MPEEESDEGQRGDEAREELDGPDPVDEPQERPPGVEEEHTARKERSREVPPEKQQKWKNWKKAWES